MNWASLEQRPRPKHRANTTFSRLFVSGAWASVMRVGRGEARHGATCEPRARRGFQGKQGKEGAGT
jgi:hypothetical protein